MVEGDRSRMHQIAPNVWQLNRRPANIFNVYLMGDVLVDSGTRWDARSLVKQLASVHLSALALTHCHPDHQGSVSRICQARGIPLACPEADVASMEGRAPMQPDNLSTKLVGIALGGPPHAVQRVLREGDQVTDFRVVHAPGHTPGHVIYFRESDRVAIAGDVLRNINPMTGKVGLGEAPAAFTADLEKSHRSIRKLAALRPSVVCFGHGPVLYDMDELDRLTARLPA